MLDLAAVVGRHTLQPADGHGLPVDTAAAAGRFARPIASPPQDRGKNIGLAVEHVSFGEFSLSDETYVFRNVGVRGTSPLAIYNFVEICRIISIGALQPDPPEAMLSSIDAASTILHPRSLSRRFESTLIATMANTRPLALVTGASAGIGATFARRLARDGYRLILVARRRDRLEALAAELGGAEILVADLTSDTELTLVEDRIARAPDLELLVNNAGFGATGLFSETPLERQDQMHRLHVMATLRLTHAALKGMTVRAQGGVINVSSVAGFGQSPGNVCYYATKAWMNSFTKGLYLEMKSAGSAVKVQALCPGFTLSEFHDVVGIDRKSIPSWMWMRAEDVVDASLKGLATGKLFVVPGAIYKVAVFILPRIPDWLLIRMAKRYRRAQ
jgi:short-subunit dehydrogenase